MKDFIDIKDVEVNNMKKRELVEANGGYWQDVFLKEIGMTGLVAPTPPPIGDPLGPNPWDKPIWW
jgi:hypothetical protein